MCFLQLQVQADFCNIIQTPYNLRQGDMNFDSVKREKTYDKIYTETNDTIILFCWWVSIVDITKHDQSHLISQMACNYKHNILGEAQCCCNNHKINTNK